MDPLPGSTGPGPTPAPQAPNIELILAQQANDAMKQGADPHAATEMLGTMIRHLRANPSVGQQASNAVSQGADPHDVSNMIWKMAQNDVPPSPAEQPGLFSRAGSMIGQGLSNLVTHPIDTAENLIASPLKSAYTAVVAPGVGEARPDARLSKGGNSSGRPIDTSAYDAAHGGVTTGERTLAGVQTLANVAAPGAFGPLSKVIGKTGALALTGATEGALYNPDDPAAGALSGGTLAPLVGGVISGATKLANVSTKTSGLTSRIKAATPLDEHALAQNKATEAATRANYGQAAAEGEAAGGTSPALQSALDHPTIKPYVDMVRESERFKNADDATVAREAYKQISKQRRGLIKRSNGPNGYDAKADLQAGDLAHAAQLLKGATAETGTETLPAPETAQSPAPSLREALGNFRDRATAAFTRNDGTVEQRMARQALDRHITENVVSPPLRGAPQPAEIETPAVMPSFPTAVSEHARMMGNRAVFNDAADMTRRVMSGRPVASNRLDTWSPAAWLDRIQQMTPEQAQYARDAVLGSAQSQIHPVIPSIPTTAAATAAGAVFGGGAGAIVSGIGGAAATSAGALTRNISRLGRIAPIIEALDARAGRATKQPINPLPALRVTAPSLAFSGNRTQDRQ